MQPLYEGQAEYLKSLVGIGKKSTIKLFADRLEVIGKDGNVVETINLRDITSAAYVKGGVFRIKVGEQLHVITFFTLPWRLFGLIGLALSGASKKGSELAEKMRAAGVDVGTKLI